MEAIIGQIVTALFVINVIMAGFVIFFGRRNPASTWVWLMVLVVFPFVGFFVYLMFGQDIRRQHRFAKKMQDDKALREQFFTQIQGGIYGKICAHQKKVFQDRLPGDSEEDFYTFSLVDLVNHNLNVDGGYLTGDNQVVLYNNGEDKFTQMLKDIKNAKKYIHMQYYIIRDDGLGNQILDALEERAANGVEVRMGFDGMGCMRCGRNFFRDLHKAGGETANFLPPLVPSFGWRINYRNHRKLAVIDGTIGYIGGINIGDEYLGKDPKFGFWRDMALRVEGSIVDQLHLRIIMDWNFAAPKPLEIKEEYFIQRPPDNFSSTRMQVVSSGPDTDYENVKNLYFKMMNEAEKSIYFTTPYFVPDDSILTALKVAALSGIDVRLIFPGKPDHPFVYWASLSYVAELLDAGVKCYQYKKEKGFIHSKMLVVDGVFASLGTANMDIRSFALNFETNAILYDEKIGKQLDEQFFIDQADSEEITRQWYDSRPKIYRVKEAVARLVSPIL